MIPRPEKQSKLQHTVARSHKRTQEAGQAMFGVDEKALAKVSSATLLRFVIAYLEVLDPSTSGRKKLSAEVEGLSESHLRNCLEKGRELSPNQWVTISKIVGMPDLYARLIAAKTRTEVGR